MSRLVYNFDVQETLAESQSSHGCSPSSTTLHGQAIIVRDSIPHYLLDLSQLDRENQGLQGVQITVKRGVWNLINAGISLIKSPEGWRFLYEISEVYKDNALLCGNLSACSRSWGSANDNTQGITLDTALTESSLTVLICDRMTRPST